MFTQISLKNKKRDLKFGISEMDILNVHFCFLAENEFKVLNTPVCDCSVTNSKTAIKNMV